MVNSEDAARIACSFLTQYYKGFVEDFYSLFPLYGDASCISFASFNESVGTTSQGKQEIRAHYDRLQEKLGQRKVQIRNADFVPSADGSVAVTCSGQVFTRLCRRVFMHSFVLAPTKYRESTFYIAAECLRFLSEESENVPSNCVIVTPEEFHRSLAERNAPPPVVADGPSETSVPRVERPPRVRRQKTTPAEESPAPAATSAPAARTVAPEAAPAAASPSDEKQVEKRERKPRVAKEGSPVRTKTLTTKVRLFAVPKFIKLSDIKRVAEECGQIVDALWFENTDAIIEFSKPAEARALVLLPSFTVQRKVLERAYYFSEEK